LSFKLAKEVKQLNDSIQEEKEEDEKD